MNAVPPRPPSCAFYLYTYTVLEISSKLFRFVMLRFFLSLSYLLILTTPVFSTQIATFLDPNCTDPLKVIKTQNGFPNGVCSRLKAQGPFASFKLLDLDLGCTGTQLTSVIACPQTYVETQRLFTATTILHALPKLRASRILELVTTPPGPGIAWIAAIVRDRWRCGRLASTQLLRRRLLRRRPLQSARRITMRASSQAGW
jgi:hypothetical protein